MIDPRQPDFADTPLAPGRPCAAYAPATALPPLVRVVVRAGPRFEETLRTLAGQSFPRWEAVVVAGYAGAPRSDDPRVRVLDSASAAALPALPYALDVAPGTLLEPTALEKWLWCLASHPGTATAGAYAVVRDTRPRLVPADVADAPVAVAAGLDVPEHLVWTSGTVAPPRLVASRGSNGDASAAVAGAPRPSVVDADTLPFENPLRKEKRRLLVVALSLSMGGADKFNLDVMDQLLARGWEVTVATTALKGPQPWHAAFARRTPDVFVLRNFLDLADYPRFLRYLVRSRGADAVLVTHNVVGYQLVPYLRAHAPGVAFLDFTHLEEEWKDRFDFSLLRSEGGYARFAVAYQDQLDANVVATDHLKRWMVAHGADGDRIDVCHTNVDVDAWRPDPEVRTAVRAELGIPDDAPVVLHAARICAQKQPAVVAAAFRALVAAGSEAFLIVAGDGPDLPWLRAELARDKANARVRILGAMPNERVKRLLAAADVFFLPSAFEGLSLAIFEAVASGVCVVAADVGGQAELVTPDVGILVPRSDPETEAQRYAETLRELCADLPRCRAMGRAGRERAAAEFGLARMGDRMAAILDGAVARAATHPVPSLGLARAHAEQAIEYARLAQERLDPYGADWHAFAYFLGRKLMLPAYRRALAAEWKWPPLVKDRLKRLVLR